MNILNKQINNGNLEIKKDSHGYYFFFNHETLSSGTHVRFKTIDEAYNFAIQIIKSMQNLIN